jgi:threonine dehydrogenase-like Zn-dependent dehydrogenase
LKTTKDYAVTFVAREKAELLEVQRPSAALGPREVEGRTVASLISAGTELAGAYLGEKFPACPGYAAVFEVERTGEQVEDIKPDSLAFCMGSHRSFQRVDRRDMLPVPCDLAPEKAVFARMIGISMTTLTTTAARPPELVLVTGLGLVGHLAARVFDLCGYEVIACDPVEFRRKTALENGIKRVLANIPVDDPAVAKKVALAVDCSGANQAVVEACKVVRKGGEVVCIGTPWKQTSDIPFHEVHRLVFFNYVVLRTGWEWELARHPTDFQHNSIWDNLAGALKWLAERRIAVDVLYRKTPPREAQAAYQGLLNKTLDRLAAVFDWTDCP